MTDLLTPQGTDTRLDDLTEQKPFQKLTTAIGRMRGGNLGFLPVVAGIIVVWIIFQSISPVFLSSRNMVQLLLQLSPIGVIALGIVFTLLVGQIDLSVGSMSGVASAVLAILMVKMGFPVAIAIVGAILAGVIIGLVYAFAFNRLGVPSFVATLAGLLALLGLQLALLGKDGAINIPFDSFLGHFGNTAFLPDWLSYALGVIAAGAIFASGWTLRRSQLAAELPARSMASTIGRSVIALVFFGLVAWYLNLDRGVAWMFVFFLVLVVIANYALEHTKWGRSIFAVGGNAEAARRAGIKVERIYLSSFVICSALAAVGGILFAANNVSANLQTGTGSVNLDAIAAPVIGGVSLFGGRGSAYAALFGMFVIQSISNGLALISPSPDLLYIVTGIVLFLAVALDSVARRSRKSHGGT